MKFKLQLLGLSLFLTMNSAIAQDSTTIGQYLQGAPAPKIGPNLSKASDHQWTLSYFQENSNGAGVSKYLGDHLFCGISQNTVAIKGQTGSCTIEKVGSDYYLRAQGDILVSGGRGINCQASCIDLVNH